MPYQLTLPRGPFAIERPIVMGILNATPDSFFAASRSTTASAVASRVEAILSEGGSMIDVGAVSTRPGSEPASEREELRRLAIALAEVRRVAPGAIVSVDTFRPTVARMAAEEYGADIINDVSEGSGDMLREVSRLGVGYVLMSVQPTLSLTLAAFRRQLSRLAELGGASVILDPGYGFGKTGAENFRLLAHQHTISEAFPTLPLLAGLSRKRMVWQTLGTTPDLALNGTTVLNTLALERGAAILRVHDVGEAVEAVRLHCALHALPCAGL